MPVAWKDYFVHEKGNSFDLTIQDLNLTKKNEISSLEKLESEELYIIQIIMQNRS